MYRSSSSQSRSYLTLESFGLTIDLLLKLDNPIKRHAVLFATHLVYSIMNSNTSHL